jgi:hypothetical protein
MKRVTWALVLCTYAFSAHSALIYRGGGFVYDDVLDITWTQNANIRDGDGPLGDGRDTWQNQVAWAAGLSLFDSVRNVTWNDWRLPTTLQPDTSCSVQHDPGSGLPIQGFGFGCTGSEMAHLANVDGILTISQTFFTNIQSQPYWSSTKNELNSNSAWHGNFVSGSQSTAPKFTTYYAWAVRDGDVAAVPVPPAVWLFCSALGLLGWMKRKKA